MKKNLFGIIFTTYTILTLILWFSNVDGIEKAFGAIILAFGALFVMLVITLFMVHRTTVDKNERIRKYIGLGLILIFMMFGLFTFFR